MRITEVKDVERHAFWRLGVVFRRREYARDNIVYMRIVAAR